MRKKERAMEIIRRLKEEYPVADCTLDYDHAWKLLVSVRLAAQCTDARVNVVVEDLYAKYPDVDALADASPEDIEAIVKPCGLGKSKARDISACMKILWEMYLENLPLLQIPTVSAWLTVWVWWTALRIRRRWRWRCGRLSRRWRVVISATVWYITGGKSVQPERSRSVTGAVLKMCVKRLA